MELIRFFMGWLGGGFKINRKHPKLEYNVALISFVVAMLIFSDQLLRAPSQEQYLHVVGLLN